MVGVLLLQGNLNVCRPLRCLVRSKRVEQEGPVVYSDASSTGLGVAVYENAVLVGYMSYVFPFDAKGSDFQCAREYFGYMLAHFVVEWLLQELVLGKEVRWEMIVWHHCAGRRRTSVIARHHNMRLWLLHEISYRLRVSSVISVLDEYRGSV